MESINRKNKGGAPKGNFNRLKHGFYSKRLRELDASEAKEMELALVEEIAMLRTLMKRYLEQTLLTDDPGKLGKALEMAGRTSVRIGTLTRIQEGINGKGMDGTVQGIIERVLGNMSEGL